MAITVKAERNIRRVAETIARKFKPEKVILFGSWAHGTPRRDSDVDFLVVKKTPNTRMMARTIDGTLFPRPFPIDLIVYQPEQFARAIRRGDFFINEEVLARGRILYDQKSSTRA